MKLETNFRVHWSARRFFEGVIQGQIQPILSF